MADSRNGSHSAPFGRLLTAMVTPFDDTGEVDYKQARRLARSLVDAGNDGLVITGTTGESPTLTHDEKLNLYRAIKEELGNDGQVIAGTGNYSTAESIELTREAEQCGVDGVLLVVPYYNNPPQEGLYQHFKKIAESTSLPCILYNVPPRSPRNLEANTLKRLAEIDNIVGVKEASGKLEQFNAVMSSVPSDFLVFSGNDSDTHTIMSLGGYGIISVAAHLVAGQIKQMVNLLAEGHISEAAPIHLNLLPLVEALFWQPNPMPVRAALNELGFAVGTPRLPLIDLTDAEKDRLRAVLAKYQFDAFLQRQPVGAKGR
ncbi:MAG TPA: 4-hydroxy-tetrahydrodipicolinate synthase [Dehalococcoidia bacterium]|nr:4-hydroxy-tetrahydrodipicolinate synthase [Dehalococcoidia bacterium]